MSETKKPDLYYFNQFVTELIDKAEIYIYGHTYKEDNNKLTVTSLVQEICDFHNKSKIKEVTRNTVELDREISRMKAVSDKQKNIVKELEFYFDEGYNQKESRLDYNRTKFYIDQEGIIPLVYDEFPTKIYDSIVESLKGTNFENIFKHVALGTRSNGPFSELFQHLQEEKLLEHNNLLSDVASRFDQFKDVYFENPPTPIPQIDGSENITLSYSRGFQRDLKQYQYSSIQEYPKSFHDIFEDQNEWFDPNRYNRLALIEPKLKELKIFDWPKWVIENVLLTELEYITIRDYLEGIIVNELNNHIKFNLFTSASGDTIDVQSNISDLPKLSNKLSDYRFPGGIQHHLDPKRGTILEGSFYKNPNIFTSQNRHSPEHIEFSILESVINYLSGILTKKIGLESGFKEELAHLVIDDMYSAS